MRKRRGADGRGNGTDEAPGPTTAPAPPDRATVQEQLAAAVVLADAADPGSLEPVRTLLEALLQRLPPAARGDAREQFERGRALLGEAPEGHAGALGAITRGLELLDERPAALAPPTAGSSGAPARLERDEDTIALFTDFVAEAGDLLSAADRLLMKMEREGAGSEQVNGLFRVFHTIKGIAGFLEIRHITDVAHTTETMLDRCRGAAGVPLEGKRIDLVFDATGMLRRMIDEVRLAVERKVECGTVEEVPAMLSRLRAAIEDSPLSEAEAIEERQALAALAALEAAADAATDTALPPPLAPAPAAGPLPSLPPATAEVAPLAAWAPGPASSPAAPPPPSAASVAALPPTAGAEGGAGEVRLRETIKVDLERVDSLVEMIGELVVVEAQVVGSPEINKLASVRVRNCLAQLAKVTRDLQDVGMRMRMVPVAGAFLKMERMVRDLSRRAGKLVRVTVTGESTEMDRTIVEQIADPLVHMIRNAVDHGVESSEDRLAHGKPAEGHIRLAAYHEGGSSVIEVADDGRGLDKAAIMQKAIERGLASPSDALTDDEIYNLIFAPGLSTAGQVTEVSGRGVGMDVVKRNLEALHGRVLIRSTPGAGTTFKIILPLTLAIIDGMLVACGSERYIIPTLSIIESIQPERSMLVSFAGEHEMINLRGQILPLLRLDRLFDLSGARTDPSEGLVVVVEGVGHRVGLLVDDVLSQQQVVIKTLGAGLGDVRFVSGAAILADGRVGLILNVEDIGALVEGRGHRPRGERNRGGLRGHGEPTAISPAAPAPAGQEALS